MEKQKLILLIILIGLLCLFVLAPIFGFALNRLTIYQSPPEGEATHELYDNDMQAAFHSEFTIGDNQRAVIKVSVINYQNVSVCRIIIISKATYDKYMSDNHTITAQAGLTFIWGNPEFGDTPGSTDWPDVTSLSLSYTATRRATIEFMGSADSSSNLISIPGIYYVVIQGTNDDPGTSWTPGRVVAFDITIEVQGPGKTLSSIFVLAGFILLLLPFIAYVFEYLKDNLQGVRR